MQKTERSASKVAAIMLGCWSLTASPACTESHAISARIDFAIHARQSGLGISLDASVSLQETEPSDSSPSRSANQNGR